MLARDAEFASELIERDRLLGDPARLEDAAFAAVENREGIAQRSTAVVETLALNRYPLAAPRIVGQPVLPFAGIAPCGPAC